jgi:cell division protein FtsB
LTRELAHDSFAPMGALREVRRRLRHVIVPTVGAFVLGYFVVHTIEGDRGILAMMSIRQQIQRAEETLAVVRAERQRREGHVALLRASGLDRDMLDEQARRVLGLVGEKEIVVFERPAKPSS